MNYTGDNKGDRKIMIMTLAAQRLYTEGKREIERRRIKLLDIIKEDKPYGNLKQKAQDMDEWRGLSLP